MSGLLPGRPGGRRWPWAAGLLVAVVLLGLYANVIVDLIGDWASDDNNTHGFLILPISLYVAWSRREQLFRLPVRPSPAGAVLLVLGLALLVLASVGAEFFLQRVSLLLVLTGLVWLILGRAFLSELAFPLAFLALMIPLPAIVMNAVAFPLQLFAAQTATACMTIAGIPVLREGNVIVMSRTTLEVAEACSGIRSLEALLALGAAYGYFTQRAPWKRWVLLVMSVPIAVAANAFRVSGTGFLAHFWGAQVAEGFYHSFAGWVVFVVAFVLLLACSSLLARLPDGKRGAASTRIEVAA